ncbi:hypothetical protein HZC27_02935 [Candidatus Roizmanbacteria bacterium]|nr:hypothetical protein [Candidatus Roizmanbacteria bacterium]
MKVNSLLFPHPVLGRKDDINGLFSVKKDGFVLKQLNENTVLSVEFVLQNKTIEDLLKNNKAVFVIEIECRSTFFRKSFSFSDPICQIELNKNLLRNTVSVSFYITINTKIQNYINENANEDYNGISFVLDAGDVIAYAGMVTFEAEILWEDLRRIFNIIKIRQDSEKEEGSAVFNLEGDIIYIDLSKKNYEYHENYKDENENFPSIYHSSLVLSCLIYALSEMMSNRGDDYNAYKWYRVLDSQKLNKPEIKELWNPSNIPQIAQIMLGFPFNRLFVSMEKIATQTNTTSSI